MAEKIILRTFAEIIKKMRQTICVIIKKMFFLIEISLPMIHMREFNEFEVRNIKYLTQKNIEYFRPTIVEHTKNPVVSQFDTLLDSGYISVDLLLSRPMGSGDTIAFKMKKEARPMLFPDNETIRLTETSKAEAGDCPLYS